MCFFNLFALFCPFASPQLRVLTSSHAFQPKLCVPTPSHAFRPPAMRSDPQPCVLTPSHVFRPPSCLFQSVSTPMGPNNVSGIVRALGMFSFFFLRVFSLICSIIHICQPPATCFDPQLRVPTPSHAFWPSSHVFPPPAMRSDLPAARFDPFQHPWAQTTCLASFGP